jgi:hypothetical protein
VVIWENIFIDLNKKNKNNNMKKTKLVLGFPGVGKTMYYMKKKGKIDVLDSDSSTFPKEGFPSNYIEHILENIGKQDVIFISTHEVVRKALKSIDIFSNENVEGVYLVYPNVILKDVYLERYKNRGNDEKFIKILDDMFENWIDELENESSKFRKFRINKDNIYLSDMSVFY